MSEPILVHVGLVGHIDHGKTALAAVLSEGVFTAGLDKHPQAKERGITIDLGFTMFRLDRFIVTLVDAPGHADLIRSVVAGANIIDAAILTVAADEGPKIQTGEHLLILDALGIESLVVAITKIDLVDNAKVESIERKTRAILKDLHFKRVEFVHVSAKEGVGIDSLKKALLRILQPRPRNINGPFLLPIDHAFSVKGHGTVVTGTVLRGKITIGDTVQLMPHLQTGKVRNIQMFGTNRAGASAGDRIGINVPDFEAKRIVRGDYLCQPNTLVTTSRLMVSIEKNPYYSASIRKGMKLNATIGLTSVSCTIVPLEHHNQYNIVLDPVHTEQFDALLLCQKTIATEPGTKVLLLRTDLPPDSMRIIGSGNVTTTNKIQIFKRKIRKGQITRIREVDVLVSGLAFNSKMAESLVGKKIQTVNGVQGTILKSFGTKGVLVVHFDAPVHENEPVVYEWFKEEVF